MTEINELIKELASPAKAPENWIRSEMARTGRRAVGTFLGFCPEELLYSAGYLPIGLWGESPAESHASVFFPAFFCAPIQNMFNRAVEGAYTGILDAVIMPVYCDALRSAGENLKIAVPHIPVLSVVYPANRKSQSGIRFLAEEYGTVKKELERMTGRQIKAGVIEESIRIYNRYRTVMRELLKAFGKHPGLISPLERHLIIKSACFVDKKDFTDRAEQLTKLINILPEGGKEGKNIILTGVMLEQAEILDLMEKLKLFVTADYLIQESLQIQTDIPLKYDGETGIEFRMASRFAEMSYCSVTFDPEKKRIEQIAEEATAQNACVIVCIPSFCTPEE